MGYKRNGPQAAGRHDRPVGGEKEQVGMVRVDLELEGSAEDVVRGLRRIVGGAGMGTVVPELGHVLPPADEVTGSEATTDMPPV